MYRQAGMLVFFYVIEVMAVGFFKTRLLVEKSVKTSC